MSGLSIASYFPFTRVKVVAQNVHAEGALIQVHPDLRWHPLCHDCRTPGATVHSQGYRRMVRDLNLADRQVWLQVAYRKVWCPQCGKERPDPERLLGILARARRFGIRRLCLLGDVIRYGYNPRAAQVREINDITHSMVQCHPEALIGFCFVNPRLGGIACLREIDRCVMGHPYSDLSDISHMPTC